MYTRYKWDVPFSSLVFLRLERDAYPEGMNDYALQGMCFGRSPIESDGGKKNTKK